jgi:5'-nucleotidase
MSPRRVIATIVVVVCATTLSTGSGAASASQKKKPVLRVVVTNDDGVEGEGMHALVDALLEEPRVEVTVVVPAEDRTGSADSTSTTPLTATDAELPNGHPATAVDGFPADSVTYALDELGLKPHVVLSGINSVQNLGPGVDLSGTVGAAKTAARRGVPALAISQGVAPEPDYDSGVEQAISWLREHRKALVKAKGRGATTFSNLNIPTCLTGEVRGRIEDLPVATGGDFVLAADRVNCESTLEDPPDDVTAFNNGFATLSEVDPD